MLLFLKQCYVCSSPPCQRTVALSRAKRKMILVASRSIFPLFLTDEEQFANLQLWKNLLRACWEKLKEGEIEGCRLAGVIATRGATLARATFGWPA